MTIQYKIYYKNRQKFLLDLKVVNQLSKENRKIINILAFMIEIKTLNVTHIAEFERKLFLWVSC